MKHWAITTAKHLRLEYIKKKGKSWRSDKGNATKSYTEWLEQKVLELLKT